MVDDADEEVDVGLGGAALELDDLENLYEEDGALVLGPERVGQAHGDLRHRLPVLVGAAWDGQCELRVGHGVNDQLCEGWQASNLEELLQVEVFMAYYDFHY